MDRRTACTIDIDETLATLDRKRKTDPTRAPSGRSRAEAREVLEGVGVLARPGRHEVAMLGAAVVFAATIALTELEVGAAGVATFTAMVAVMLFVWSGLQVVARATWHTMQRVAIARLLDAGYNTGSVEELAGRCVREGHSISDAAGLLIADLADRS